MIDELLIAALLAAAAGMVSCLSAKAGRIRLLPRWAWILTILLIPAAGAVAWFAAGRPRRTPNSHRKLPPASPDDDPDFLHTLR